MRARRVAREKISLKNTHLLFTHSNYIIGQIKSITIYMNMIIKVLRGKHRGDTFHMNY